MSKEFDMIAKVNIDLADPLMKEDGFGKILIVGPLPAVAPEDAPPEVAEYFSLDEVTDAGWVAIGDDADPIGTAARVAFSQKKKPESVVIAPIQVDDDDAAEKAVETVKRAMNNTGWYVVCPAGVNESEYEEIAQYIETTERGFAYTEMGFFGTSSNKPTVDPKYLRSWGIYGREYKGQPDNEVPEENKYMNVGFMVSCLRYESGSETFAFKPIALCSPADLSTADMNALEAGNISYFVSVGNKNVTMGGKTLAGEWIDVIRFRDWLKNDMQTRVVALFTSTSKVPFTDPGIGLVENQMLASLKAGQDVGGIAPTEFDEDGNEIPGYSTSVPLASSIDAATKKSRKLTGCKFGARLAGAIHIADLDGSLSYTS